MEPQTCISNKLAGNAAAAATGTSLRGSESGGGEQGRCRAGAGQEPLQRLLVWGPGQPPTSHGLGEFHPHEFSAVDKTTDISSSP